jgi:MFS family permease
MWSPILLKSTGLNLIEIGWLSGCLYALVTLVKVTVSFISDRTAIRRGFIWPFFLLAAVAFYTSYAMDISQGWPACALFIVAGLGANGPAGILFAYIADMLPRNVSGRIFALINSAGALGSFVGVYVIGATSSLFRGAGASYLTIAAMSLVALCFSLFLPRLSTQLAPAVR